MTTQHRDLRTGQPIWLGKRAPRIKTNLLIQDVETDVAVIGAGISGALMAESLSEAGYEVAIFDRRLPVTGSTPASTALLQFEIDVPLHHLARKIGQKDAERAWRRSKLAVDLLRERTRRLGIKCEMENRDSLYLAGDLLDEEGLQKELNARRRAGFETRMLSKAELNAEFNIDRDAALMSFDNIEANPRRLAIGYLCKAMERGAKVFAPADIASVESNERTVVAVTTTGQKIRCKHLIFATGYEIPEQVPQKGHSITSTWALATLPQKRNLWPQRCLIWEASDPYLYLRTTTDGRIIVGGEDEKFEDEEKRDVRLPAKTKAILAKLKKLFPGIVAEADYAWTGSFGASSTGLPSIGAVPGMHRCYAVLGYGGNGITFSMVAAQLIHGLIRGTGDPDEDLFAFK
ncbi:NAD(P)/FAD-dependent oxidoreductase [Phyllobacterium zundukense]|uniref:FAD-dependent oxidoreductase n=1 Tax=Phyllobacterium zundukense TaxID=1867719 RepID=A0A2N9W2F2_9HYPH|nr:FAD-dependent oxidoreductase [Phyllobacterium zundukense]ATU91112.1 FAD-dependent oxidoreductase [Phyllobacterium zundukense]PIO45920.1 FAD-dependent oxidoreductase [Phyllobacterium zundukense]